MIGNNNWSSVQVYLWEVKITDIISPTWSEKSSNAYHLVIPSLNKPSKAGCGIFDLGKKSRFVNLYFLNLSFLWQDPFCLQKLESEPWHQGRQDDVTRDPKIFI